MVSNVFFLKNKGPLKYILSLFASYGFKPHEQTSAGLYDKLTCRHSSPPHNCLISFILQDTYLVNLQSIISIRFNATDKSVYRRHSFNGNLITCLI